jgi:hypothetical protein
MKKGRGEGGIQHNHPPGTLKCSSSEPSKLRYKILWQNISHFYCAQFSLKKWGGGLEGKQKHLFLTIKIGFNIHNSVLGNSKYRIISSEFLEELREYKRKMEDDSDGNGNVMVTCPECGQVRVVSVGKKEKKIVTYEIFYY